MPFRRNAVRHQIEQTPESVCKRNYPAMLTEGIFFLMGFAFIDINAVIPVFIHSYTNSVFLAGLASTLYHASSFVMEILIGPYVKRIRNVPRYVSWLALLFRPLPLLMVPILFMNISPLIKVGSFLVMYALLRGGDGLIYISWGDLFDPTRSKKGVCSWAISSFWAELLLFWPGWWSRPYLIIQPLLMISVTQSSSAVRPLF